MKLVGVVPSSSTYTRKWGGSTKWQGRIARHEREQQKQQTNNKGGARRYLKMVSSEVWRQGNDEWWQGNKHEQQGARAKVAKCKNESNKE
jgi:hypothetical protein